MKGKENMTHDGTQIFTTRKTFFFHTTVADILKAIFSVFF